MAESWRPGDRVSLVLPDRSRPRYLGQQVRVSGTVREVDPPGLRRGVRVDLDRPVNGVSSCFATHAELKVLVHAGREKGDAT